MTARQTPPPDHVGTPTAIWWLDDSDSSTHADDSAVADGPATATATDPATATERASRFPPEPVQAGDDRNYCAKPGPPRADNSLSPCNGDSRCHCAAPLGAAQIPAGPGGVGLSTEEIRALPAAFAFDPVVPAAFGLSRSAAYRALAAGQLPIRTLRLGRKLIVTRADLMAALNIEDVQPSQAAHSDDEHRRTDVLLPDRTGDTNLKGDR